MKYTPAFVFQRSERQHILEMTEEVYGIKNMMTSYDKTTNELIHYAVNECSMITFCDTELGTFHGYTLLEFDSARRCSLHICLFKSGAILAGWPHFLDLVRPHVDTLEIWLDGDKPHIKRLAQKLGFNFRIVEGKDYGHRTV